MTVDDRQKLVEGNKEVPSFGSIQNEDPVSKDETDSVDSETDKTIIRWYILTLFCLWALTNSAFWNTWGPIAQSSMLVFGWSQLDVVLPVILGTFATVITQILYSWLLETIGLRLSALISSGLMLVGAGVRCITSYAPAATWLINFAAILNGLGAPIFVGGAPVISAIWFPADERITATSSGIAFAYGGIAFAFLLGPFVVNYNPVTFPGAILPASTTTVGANSTQTVPTEPSALSTNFSQGFIDNQRHNIMNLMYIEFGWVAFLFLVTIAYFPDKPVKPPSLSALQDRSTVWEGLKASLRQFQFWMILMPFALTQGFFFGWGSALELNLHPIGITQDQAGWIGFASSITGIAGTLTTGRIADVFSQYIKPFVIIILTVAVIFAAWMTAIIDELTKLNFACLLIATVVSATATQATCPLYYEMACESSYPVSESVVGGILTMAGNILNVMFLLVFLIPNVGTRWLNYALIAALVGSIIFTCFYEHSFRRLAIDTGSDTASEGQSQEADKDSENEMVDSEKSYPEKAKPDTKPP